MKYIQFWHKWLLTVTILIILFGILLMVPNKPELFDRLFNDHIETIFWSDTPITTGIVHFQRWLYGVLGATMIGWGIMMAFIIAIPFRRGERWAWYSIFFGIGGWYILDTAVSVMYHADFNAFFNSLILLLFLPPLLFTYSSFHTKQRTSIMV